MFLLEVFLGPACLLPQPSFSASSPTTFQDEAPQEVLGSFSLLWGSLVTLVMKVADFGMEQPWAD